MLAWFPGQKGNDLDALAASNIKLPVAPPSILPSATVQALARMSQVQDRNRVRVLAGHLIPAQQDHGVSFRLESQCTRAKAIPKMLAGQVQMHTTLS